MMNAWAWVMTDGVWFALFYLYMLGGVMAAMAALEAELGRVQIAAMALLWPLALPFLFVFALIAWRAQESEWLR